MPMSPKYPVFRNPEAYMAMRQRPTLTGRLKMYFERRALARCIEDLPGVRSVCDVPAGPGRLFSAWKEHRYRVYGVDYSEEMFEMASRVHKELGLKGEVFQGDAFHLNEVLPETPDLIASVRFIYYFDSAKRVELLKSLAGASRRYVLVQYKTKESLKGHMKRERDRERGKSARPRHLAKAGCSHRQILSELTAAGLTPLRIEPIGEFSDRTFVLAEKTPAAPAEEQDHHPEIRIQSTPRWNLAATVFFLLALVYALGTSANQLFQEEEAFYALGARSIAEGRFLLPSIYEGVPAATPPLIFWWQAAWGAILGGITDITVHIASLAMSFAALGASYLLVRKRAGRETGILAMLILGTSWEFFLLAGMPSVEMLLALCLVPAWWAWYRISEHDYSRSYWLVAWGGIGLAGLAAGLAGLALGLLPPLVYTLLISRSKSFGRRLSRLEIGGGLVLLAAPLATWALLAGFIHGTEAVKQVLISNDSATFARLFGQATPWYYTLFELPLNLLPWSLVVPVMLLLNKRQTALAALFRFPWMRFCNTIVIVGLLVVFLQDRREEFFLMPLQFFGAFILAGLMWHQATGKAKPLARRGSSTEIRQFWGQFLGRRVGRIYASATALILAGFIVYTLFAAWVLEDRFTAPSSADIVNRLVDEDDRLFLYEIEDLRLVFYLHETFEHAEGTDNQSTSLRKALSREAEVDVVIRAKDFPRLDRLTEEKLYIQRSFKHLGETYFLVTNEDDGTITKPTVLKR